jgi:hypothetical protein
MLGVFEQMIYQEPVHLEHLDPAARVFDEADPCPGIASAIGDLKRADVV